VFVFEPGGRILFTNPAAAKPAGIHPGKTGRNEHSRCSPAGKPGGSFKLLAGLVAGQITICPVSLQAGNGTRIPVETKILHGQWRGKRALFGIAHDITGRKRLEAALRESEEKYQRCLNALTARRAKERSPRRH